MPNHTPMPIWERGQGHTSRTERPDAYSRFRAWLELGPARSLAAYAAALGISRQALSETARRYCWRERAAAWDRAEAAAGRCPPPPPPRPPKQARRREAPPPPDAAEQEVLRDAAAARGEDDPNGHRQQLRRYHRVYERLGQAFATEAEAAMETVAGLYADVALMIELRRTRAAAGDDAGAAAAARTAGQLVQLLARLVPCVLAMANAGRTHWGDAIGVQRILQEVLAADAEAEKREAKAQQ
ncbi:MAG: hypothetical protein ACKOZT_10880 [Cyanobium sp.]